MNNDTIRETFYTKIRDLSKENAALWIEISDLKQQIKNLDNYVLEGIAFRDKLQAELERHKQAFEWVVGFCDVNALDDKPVLAYIAEELRRRVSE